MFKSLLLFSPIQSFIVTGVIKGLTLFNSMMIIFILPRFFIFNKSNIRFIQYLSLFLFTYILYFFIAQLAILTTDNNLSHELILISNESFNNLEFRKSFITQSLYLFIVLIFFYTLIEKLTEGKKNEIIKVSFLSIWLLMIYGYFEFFMYLLTGNNFDFISNRIAGEDFHVGLFQTTTLAGTSIQRMKSLAGEPSMYAYTLLPFFILSMYLKRYTFASISFLTLLLTTSSTAILGIGTYLLLNLIYMKNKLFIIFIYLIIAVFLFVIFYDVILSMYNMLQIKLNLENESGIVRFTNFFNHLEAWYNSNIINMLFGYGFGYFRSTDGLSTILINIGFIGLILYCLFFLLPYFLIKKRTNYIIGLYISNFSLLIVILIGVPEFYYPHIWLFNALLWYEYIKEYRLIKASAHTKGI